MKRLRRQLRRPEELRYFAPPSGWGCSRSCLGRSLAAAAAAKREELAVKLLLAPGQEKSCGGRGSRRLHWRGQGGRAPKLLGQSSRRNGEGGVLGAPPPRCGRARLLQQGERRVAAAAAASRLPPLSAAGKASAGGSRRRFQQKDDKTLPQGTCPSSAPALKRPPPQTTQRKKQASVGGLAFGEAVGRERKGQRQNPAEGRGGVLRTRVGKLRPALTCSPRTCLRKRERLRQG